MTYSRSKVLYHLTYSPFFQEIQGHQKKHINTSTYPKADELYVNSRGFIRIDSRSEKS